MVVIGAHRSGTSSLAMALAALGVYFGEEGDLFHGDQFNREGYWEHKRIAKLNRGMLLSLNVAQSDIDRIPDDWLELPTSEGRVEKFCNLIREEFSGRPLWGWKDPESSLLMPFTKEVLSRLSLRGHYVICVRNPLDVAASQRRRSGSEEWQTIGSWLRRTLWSLAGSIGESRTVVLFDDMQSDLREVLKTVTGASAGFRVDDAAWASAIATQDKELVHPSSAKDEIERLPDLVQRTIGLCLAAAHDAPAFRQGAYDDEIRSLESELDAWHLMARRTEPPRGIAFATWQDPGGAASKEVAFEAARRWIPVKIEVDAPPAITVRLGLYQMPASIWIRSAVWRTDNAETPAHLVAGVHGILLEEAGMQRLWPRFGKDQLRAETPAGKGPYTIVLEIMVETNMLITATQWRGVSEQFDETLFRGSPHLRP